MELPAIAEVKRLTLHPGDRLVVNLDRQPSDMEVHQLKLRLQAILGDDVPVLVLSPGIDLEVLGPAADGEPCP